MKQEWEFHKANPEVLFAVFGLILVLLLGSCSTAIPPVKSNPHRRPNDQTTFSFAPSK